MKEGISNQTSDYYTVDVDDDDGYFIIFPQKFRKNKQQVLGKNPSAVINATIFCLMGLWLLE
jgi:hypothetical protein